MSVQNNAYIELIENVNQHIYSCLTNPNLWSLSMSICKSNSLDSEKELKANVWSYKDAMEYMGYVLS